MWWVWVPVNPEGCCHMADGTADCAWSQGRIAWLQKSPFTQSHGNSTEDVASIFSGEFLKEDVFPKPCGLAIFFPPSPWPSMVYVCTSLYHFCTGSFCSSEVTQQTILLGRGTILKVLGICEGTWVTRIWVSSASVLSMSRESASATLFWDPGNHWLYPQIPWFMYLVAWLLATSILTIAWTWSISSLKFVFRINPSDVILSVLDRASCPLLVGPQGCGPKVRWSPQDVWGGCLMHGIALLWANKIATQIPHGYNLPCRLGMSLSDIHALIFDTQSYSCFSSIKHVPKNRSPLA